MPMVSGRLVGSCPRCGAYGNSMGLCARCEGQLRQGLDIHGSEWDPPILPGFPPLDVKPIKFELPSIDLKTDLDSLDLLRY